MLNELAQRIMEAQRKARWLKHNRQRGPGVLPHTHATMLGYRCERRIVYQRTRPEEAAPIGEELASIFEEGNLHQTAVRRELSELGFEVVEAECTFRDNALEISGTIDGRIAVEELRGRRVPGEIKSCTGTPPQTAEEMAADDGLYGRYFAQMEIYLHLTDEAEGLFIFKDKITGLMTVVPVDHDQERVEGLLAKAARVRDHVRAGTLPDRLADRSECSGCPFRESLCHPEEERVDPLLLANDIVLKAQVERRADLDVSRTEYDKLNKLLMERFKLTAGDRFLVGSEWLVTKKIQKNGTRILFARLNPGAQP
jgi:hypothetical protein